jgi:hypothetical protein
MKLCKICKKDEAVIDMCVRCSIAIDFIERMGKEKSKSFERGQLFATLTMLSALLFLMLLT